MTTMVDQRTLALRAGNERRLYQARFKRELRSLDRDEARERVCAVLVGPPDELGAMRVEAVLTLIHRIGWQKATAICRRAGVHPQRRLRDLTDNERGRLCRVLQGLWA